MDELAERLAALEERVREQEQELAQLRAGAGSRVCAPFVVVDETDHAILEVAARGDRVHLRLMGPAGTFLVTLTQTAGGGAVAVHDTEGREVAGLASGPHGGSLSISDDAGNLVAWVNVTESGGHFITRDHEGRVTSR